jgi:hypothetical protein
VPTTPTVDVVGLRALVRDVNRLCDDAGPLNKALSAAGRAAAEPVAAATRSALPDVTGTLRGDVRVLAARSGAKVAMGRGSIPYAGPVEFGGYPGNRPFHADGRYLFPAARTWASTAADIYSAGAQKAFDSFSWSNETTNAESVHD